MDNFKFMDSWPAWARWLVALAVCFVLYEYAWWPFERILWALGGPQLVVSAYPLFNVFTLIASFLFVWCGVCIVPRFKPAIGLFLGLFPLGVPYAVLRFFLVDLGGHHVSHYHAVLYSIFYVPKSWWNVAGVLIAWGLIGWGYLRRRRSGSASRPLFAVAIAVVGLLILALALLALAPSNPKFKEFALPNPCSYPEDITLGPDGNMWFTERGGDKIGRITPNGDIKEFQLDTWGGCSERDALGEIVSGADGALWFAEGRGRIGRITVDGSVKEFALPPKHGVAHLALGPDGNVWFPSGSAMWRITPKGELSDLPMSSQTAGRNQWYQWVGGIAVGPNRALWFTANIPGQIKSITLDGTVTTQLNLPAPRGESPGIPVLQGIATDETGHVWFTEKLQNTQNVVSFSPGSQPMRIPLEPYSGPERIAVSPTGSVWISLQSCGCIAEISGDGKLTTIAAPTPKSGPTGIAVDAEGRVWFTETSVGKIAYYCPSC